MAKMCATCKWGYIGRFDARYGGCPVGCTKKDAVSVSIRKCYEPKEPMKTSKHDYYAV